jgi:hypothetical protein
VAHARTLLEALGIDGGHLETCDMPEEGLVEKEAVEEMIQRMDNSGQTDSV